VAQSRGQVSLYSAHLLAPTHQTREFIGVCLNYLDHALEAKMALFSVPRSCVRHRHNGVQLAVAVRYRQSTAARAVLNPAYAILGHPFGDCGHALLNCQQ
jgi:hypothetical protein